MNQFLLIHLLLHFPFLHLISPLQHYLSFLIFIHSLPMIRKNPMLSQHTLTSLSILRMEIIQCVISNMILFLLVRGNLVRIVLIVLLSHLKSYKILTTKIFTILKLASFYAISYTRLLRWCSVSRAPFILLISKVYSS